MCTDTTGKQQYVGINKEEQRVDHVREQGPQTRSQTFVQFLIGTIIRKKIGNRKYYEGEVTKYDATNKFYTVKYTDGNISEYSHQEIISYKKKKQAYTKKRYSTYLLEKKYDRNIFFIPTKVSPNPIKNDYLKTGTTKMH